MKPDPIDRPVLERLIENARWAPTHGLTEPWRFVVFLGEARRALVEAVLSTMTEDGKPLPPDDAVRVDTTKKMMTPPVVMAIVCQPGPGPKVVEHEEIISVGIAVQNIALAARTLGIASYWTSGKKAFHPRMAEFLNLTPPARCLGFFYLGYPAIPWPAGKRAPIAEKIQWRE